MINLYEAQVARLEAMLLRLDTYLERTRNIYDGMEANMNAIRRGILRLEMQTQCRTTGIVSLPTLEETEKMRLIEVEVESFFVKLKFLSNIFSHFLFAFYYIFRNFLFKPLKII